MKHLVRGSVSSPCCEYARCPVVVGPPAAGRPVSTPAAGTYALLTDGTTAEISQARPQDFEAVRAMHAALSPDNMYLRFFSMSPGAARQEAKRVCREPDSEHAALLAWQDGRLAGVGAYEATGKPGVAEVSFAVPDDMHGRGIASVLLEHLVWQARQRGLAAFTAETLAENSAMLRVFADASLPARRRIAGGTVELTFPLPAGDDDYRLGSYLEAVANREAGRMWRACARCWVRGRSPWWARAAAAAAWAGPSCTTS